MLKLTPLETEVVKAFNIKPEDWQVYDFRPAREFNYRAIATYCMHLGYSDQVYDVLSAGALIQEIRDKFWADDGFSGTDLEDVAMWVLTTYIDATKLEGMTGEEVEAFLKDWKYYFGFRKCDGRGWGYKVLALEALNGVYKLDPNDPEISYVYANYLV